MPDPLVRKLLAACTALAFSLSLSACQSQQQPQADTALLDSLNDVTLATPAHLPADLRVLGSAQAWVLPSGWQVASSGVRRDGDRLVMDVVVPEASSENLFGAPAGPEPTQTWVVDTDTGTTHRYGPIDEGWSEITVIAAGGWMLREEVTQPPDGDADWRLYAQPLDSPNPRLLARSTQPGDQGEATALVTDGRKIAWEQGDASGKYTIKLWTPGARAPVTVAERHGQGLLDFTDDGKLFIGETAQGSKRTRTVTQIPLPGQANTAAMTTFQGLLWYTVAGQTLTYFPGRGDGYGQWMTIPLGTSAISGSKGDPISPGIDGAYLTEWITASKLLSWSATGLTVFDLEHPANTVTSTSTRIAPPRVDAGYLGIGYNPSKGESSMAISKNYN